VSDGSQNVRDFAFSRRRLLQMGAAGALAVPLATELGQRGAGAATRTRAASHSHPKPDPSAILAYGQMQGESYDPIHQVGVEYIQLFAIFDMLLSYNADGKIETRLAESYQASADKVRLNLRPGVTFQDGTAFNAQAVQYSLNRVLHDPASSIASNVSMLDSVQVVNDHTVDLMMNEPAIQALLFQLADRAGMIVSPTAVEKAGSSSAFSQAPVGAGAYAIDGAWFPREKMSVRKWSGYWDKASQTLGGVDFTNVLEGATTNAMRSGAVDIDVLAASDATALKGNSSVVVKSAPGSFTMGLNINLTKPPFNNLKVRQAVAHSIDRAAVNQALTSGLGEPAFQFATSNSPAYDASLNKLYEYDPDKAKSLLKQAGYGSGLTFPAIIGGTATAFVQFGELIQSQMAQAGINMQLQQIAQATVIPMLWGTGNGNHGTAIAAPIGGGVAVTGLAQSFSLQTLATGYENTGGFEVPGMAAILSAAASAPTFAQAAKLYQKANRLVTQGVYVMVPVFTGPSLIGYQNYVGGNPVPETANGLPDFLRGIYVTQGKVPV
jgi:ABC-type transport system substrate-binding protein